MAMVGIVVVLLLATLIQGFLRAEYPWMSQSMRIVIGAAVLLVLYAVSRALGSLHD